MAKRPKKSDRKPTTSKAKGSASREAFAPEESLERRRLVQTVDTSWFQPGASEKEKERIIEAAFAALQKIGPRDEVESMLAAQMIAVHNATMECFRRAMLVSQSFEGMEMNLKYGAKLAETYQHQMEALAKKRGKNHQKITVEHVDVHDGGQAIIGNVRAPATKEQGEGRASPRGGTPANSNSPLLEHSPGDAFSRLDQDDRAERDERGLNVVPRAGGERR